MDKPVVKQSAMRMKAKFWLIHRMSLGGDPADKDNVDISITNDGRTGATVDPTTGKIVVPNGLIPGTHTINYKVCEKGSSINCQTSTLKVVIPDNIVVDSTPDEIGRAHV